MSRKATATQWKNQCNLHRASASQLCLCPYQLRLQEAVMQVIRHKSVLVEPMLACSVLLNLAPLQS